MARNESPPFSRGKTYFNGVTIDTSTTPYGGTNLEGKEWVFEDTNYGTGLYVTCRVVRNVSGAALLPKRLVSFSSTYYGQRVDGYATTTAQVAYPVDELLPTAGVVNNDLFYVVTKGPCLVKTDLAGGASNVIAVGDPLVSLTAATSGATTSGRIATASFAGATSVLALPVLNTLGRAMSAATTANTNGDMLTYITASF